MVCIRWTDSDLQVHEDFIGLYKLEKTDAKSITAAFKDTLMRLQLSMNNCRGQCYDGCSTMAGAKGGVAAMIKSEEPRALFTHCYGHSLNLAVSDTLKKKILKDATDTLIEVTKLIKKSPKRDSKLEQIKKAMTVSSETT